MLLTILATANHFVLDAIMGAVIPVLSWKINEILLLFRALEEWCFWLCRTERPIPKDGIGDVRIPDEKPGVPMPPDIRSHTCRSHILCKIPSHE